MANKIKLDVELQTQVKNTKALHKEVSKDGKFDDSGIKNSLKTLSKFEDVTEMTEKEFKSFNDALQKVTNALYKHLSDNGKLSAAAIELKKKVDEQLTSIKNIKKNQVQNEKESQERKKSLTEKMGGKTIHAIDEKGALKKEKLSEEEVATKLAKGEKIGFQDDKGKIQEVTSESELGKAALAYNETIEKSQRLATSFENATNILIEHSTKLREQMAQDLGVKIEKAPSVEEKIETKEAPKEVKETKETPEGEPEGTKTLGDQLKESLLQLLDALKGLNLTDQQKESVSRHTKGAELALYTEDWKEFQTHFNAILKTFKTAASASDELSTSIKALTDKQGNLNQEINDLEKKKTDLNTKISTDKSGKTVLSKTGAEEFFKTSKDAEKVILSDGSKATREEIIKIQEALNKYLQETGKELSKLTKEDVSKINSKLGESGINVKDRNSLFAANRYTKAENAEPTRITKEIAATDKQIEGKTNELNNVKSRLEELNTAAKSGADSINALYIKINEMANAANKAITKELNKESEEKADKTPVAPPTAAEDIKPIKEQTSGLGKAFKQFTIYNIALRAVKKALREAVSTVKELDKELTEQAMVTGKTREQTYKLVKSYQDLAIQTGATTKEIAGVATEYMKQGKSTQEAMTLTEAAVSAAKVARVSTADSVNYLTTALNGFQLSANDAMLVSDKFAAVAAASATDYDELAIALSKVASQANLAGMSIDYTTALLTKGLETTREAPETMGTALKTIIARMRELGDYGETLEGDTDINNVESQLAYVGIALRNNEGELRSTEEVLDELGKKWDTLDKNQQAAVAKALAGTRQQSRLIAMMSDYERVTELQEIAARSAGATAAQAGVYLEGIEASLNTITVAWEKIVTAVTDSDAIVSLLEFVGNTLATIGDFMSTDFGMVATLTTIVGLTAASLSNKMQEIMYQKTLAAAERQRQVLKLKERQSELKAIIAGKQQVLLEKQKSVEDKKQLKFTTIEEKLKKGELTTAQAEAATKQAELDANKSSLEIQQELNDLSLEMQANEMTLSTLNQTNADSWGVIGQTVSMVAGGLGTLITGSSAWLAVMTAVGLAFKIIPPIIKTIHAIHQMQIAQETAGETKKSLIKMAGAATGLGVPGLIIAAALMALAGLAAVGAVIGGISKSKETTEDKVNNLSNEIYKLNEKANAINQVTSSFDKLDNKIIKTNKDMEEMNSLLEQAADKLDDSVEDDEDVGYGKGISEKEYYQSLSSDKLRREFLDQIEKETQDKIRKAREDQINLVRGNAEYLNDDTTDAEVKKIQSTFYANAIANLQDYIDKLKEAGDLSDSDASAVEKLTQKMIEEAKASEAFNFADNEKSVQQMVDSIRLLETKIENANGDLEKVSMAEILTSDDYGITQKAEAFRALKQELGAFSDEYKLLEQAYSEYAVFAEMGDDVLEMIDYLGMTIADINDLQSAWSTLKKQGLNISESEYTDLITSELLPTLAASGNDIGSTIDLVFGKYLTDAETYEQTYNAIVNSFSQIIGQGMLNMGQSITKLKNTVNSFYEKATEWATMSDQEKSEFMSENAALFEGQTGVELLNALNTNNWKEMERILQEADGMQDQIEEKLKWIETELSIEEARIGEARNEAYIQQLKAWKNELEDSTNFFRADLQLLLDQEQAQLDIYRDYLEKQQEQLEESLDKRREAYEKYFEAINQQQENDDYWEQSNKLITNLSKLSTATDMTSQKQAKELKQQLEDLEKERQQTLRERAQEAVMESIDSEVEKISEKFDKLLNNEQLLLEALQAEQNNPNFLTTLMASAREDGMTDLQLEEFANELNSAFGSSIDTSNVQEIMEQIQNNATINIGDQTFDLNSEDGNAVWETILAMLVKYGYGR